MNIKGSLPLLILQTLSTNPGHGYGIAQEIKRKSEGLLEFAEGTLYPTLHDLEKRGLINAGEEVVNGRTRRIYRLTVVGRKELAKEREQWKEHVRLVSLILGDTL